MTLSPQKTFLRRILPSATLAVLVFGIVLQSADAATTTKKTVVKKPTVTVGKPTRLSIPRLKINAAVDSIGLDRSGRIGLPSRSSNVAWFNQSVRPGQPGNAIMNGHLDTFLGPAVFWRLRNAKRGDDIVVTDERNRTYRFRVTTVRMYDRNAPIYFEDVFDHTTRTKLSLITCAGRWNWRTRQYSHNLVVTAEIVKPVTSTSAR